MLHQPEDAALGSAGSVLPLLRGEGLQRQRMNLSADAIPERRVDPLVAAHAAQAGEFFCDHQRFVVPLAVGPNFGARAGHPGLNQVGNFSWIHG